MYKGTTPTIKLTFGEDVDFSDAESVVVTFATDYHKTITEKTGNELEITDNVISVSFTQAETLAICTGVMLVQVNVLYSDGTRVASEIRPINWNNNLKNEVMS